MSFLRPCLVVGGLIYPLRGSCVIGRFHTSCPSNDCVRKGFLRAPDIPIMDVRGYISRHHARIELDTMGGCWIDDLRSLNGTAIFHVGQYARPQPSPYLERLAPGMRYRLSEGDIVALAYHQYRGPYFAVSYYKSGRW